MNLSKYDFDTFFEFYDVTEDGRVFEKISGKELKQYLNAGYLEVRSCKADKSFRFKVHRLVAKKYLSIPIEFKNMDLSKIHINHIDGNKKNNHYSNLEWCNAYKNNLHARITGLNPISSSNSKRWLDDAFRSKTSTNISVSRKALFSSGKLTPTYKYWFISPISNKKIVLKDAYKELSISYSKGYKHLRLLLSGEENIFSEIGYVLEGQSTIEKRFINTKSTE